MKKQLDFDPLESCILFGYRGSIAHNLYIDPEHEMGTDDIDLMGVTIAPIGCYFGLDKFEQKEIMNDPEDIIVYDIRKFFRLLLKGNPNVLSFLWNRKDMFTEITPLGQQILDNKHIFSSQYCFKSFAGYARSQMKKMLNQSYQGYMGSKRKAIVDKYGYDTKNASHLIRLLTMGIEFLKTGEMNVYRVEDNERLIDIKCGKFNLHSIEMDANKLFKELESALEESALPEFPNYNKINELLVSIMYQYFNRNKISDDLMGSGVNW